jgi:S1-C subfamily serine protease
MAHHGSSAQKLNVQRPANCYGVSTAFSSSCKRVFAQQEEWTVLMSRSRFAVATLLVSATAGVGTMPNACVNDSSSFRESGVSRANLTAVPRLDSAQLARVCAAAAPALVRISSSDNSRSQCGVIISPDGLVISCSTLGNPGLKMKISLSDGRTVMGVTLGESEELGIGLLKITESGNWPHAAINRRADLMVGKVGVVLGYPRNGDGTFDVKPTARLAGVPMVSVTGWAGVDCSFDFSEFGCALFDLEGRLVGTLAAATGTQPLTFALAGMVDNHRAVLQTGKCLDNERIVSREKLASAKEIKDQLTADQLKKAITATTQAGAIMASVKIEVSPGNSFSGTLVGEDGIVVTCAHTSRLPGDNVVVVFSDGRKISGTVLGTNRIADIGLIRLQKPGPWPGVKMGDSSQVTNGQPCLIIGYPADPDHPRRMEVIVPAVRPIYGYSPTLLFTSLNYQLFGGMSGGGVFDREGRLVAVHCGGGNPRIEMVQAQWKQLLGEAAIKTSDSNISFPVSKEILKRCFQTVVSIERDQKRVALGTIVDKSGLVVTKSSLVGDEVPCRLHDGCVLSGKVILRWPQFDLALLQLHGAPPLAAVCFPASDNCSVGTLIWASVPGAYMTTGIIGHTARRIGLERREGNSLHPSWESTRRSGFAGVASCDLAIRASACGCPVFTPNGDQVGIGIASTVPRSDANLLQRVDPTKISGHRRFSGAYVLPAAFLKNALDEYGDH